MTEAIITTAGRRVLNSRIVRVFILLFVCLYPLLPSWLDRRLPATHEGYRYLLLSDWFSGAIAAGVWYPRWLPEMNGGFGYPEFVFYQPAYFFINALLSLGVEALLFRQLLTLSLIALLGGFGVYRLACCYVAPTQALLLVVCFQLAPYVHTNLYVRGDLSEWMVQELAVWPIFFLLQFCREGFNSTVLRRLAWWVGLVLSTAIICYSHPVGLMFLPPILLFIGSILLVSDSSHSLRDRFVTGGELIAAVLMGLILSSPYWLTVLMMKPLVHVAAASDGFVAWKNTVPLSQLLFGSLINGKDFKEFLGAPFAAAALSGWWFGRKQPLILGAGLAYIVIVLAMTPLGQFLWKLYPLSLLQFPWRLAVFAPVLQVCCFAGFYTFSGVARIGRSWLIGGFSLLVCWSLFGHFGFHAVEASEPDLQINSEALACLRNFAQTSSPGNYASTIDVGEWMPLTAKAISAVPARGEIRPACNTTRQTMAGIAEKIGKPGVFKLTAIPRPLVEVSRQGWTAQKSPAHTDFQLDYQLSGGLPAVLTINQLYLPGWKIMVNNKKISRQDIERGILPDGRMQLALPPGEWHIQAWYDGPPGWKERNWLIAVLCFIAAIYWSCRGHATGQLNEL